MIVACRKASRGEARATRWVLIRSGAAVEHWRLPLELDERPEHGASISYDDVIDFHEALDRLPTAVR